jgi:hypothetical protein
MGLRTCIYNSAENFIFSETMETRNNHKIKMPNQSKPAIPRSISQSALAKKDRLKEDLKKDMKKPDDDAKVHYLERFSVFTFRLPSMRGRSQEFMRYFLNHVLDNNIDFDLHDAKIINWWTPFLKKLFPLSTVGK